MEYKNQFTGVRIDSRTESEKLKDYMFDEIVTSADAVHWMEKPQGELRTFPVQDQSNSGSCVAQTIKKMALIQNWLKEKSFLEFSATSIYTHRSNKPQGGMIGIESFEIWRNKGITLEALVPSNLMSNQAMDAMAIEPHEKQIGEVFKIGNHVGITEIGYLDLVASIIQRTGKGVMVWYYFNHDEWSKLVPTVNRKINLYAPTTSRHSVTAVDFALLPDGRKALLVEDSAHFGGLSRRWVTEDFHEQRNFFARYNMNFVYEIDDTTPPSDNPKIKKTLRFGMRNTDVVVLQDILKQKGFFPTNIASTGYFGAITKKSVAAFQKANGLVADGIVGKNTIKALYK